MSSTGEQALGLLRNSLKGSGEVHKTLKAAIDASMCETAQGKQWVVLPTGDNTLREVHEALKQGNTSLGVIFTAEKGPVSQIEVLRAMEYGGVYCAAAELGSSASSVIQEATAFTDGSSFLLLATSAAIQGDGKWTPFTYDPRREAAGLSAFQSDSSNIRKEIEGFLARESLLTLIAKQSVGAATSDEADAGALAEGLGDASKTVTILYTSDTGHAEECAKAVARQCRNGGYASSSVRCGTLDSFDVNALGSEPLVILCIATAGKGEFPGNGRNFWNKLNDQSKALQGSLSTMKYAVFGLGDSHYWGKGTEDSRVNFAKPARELDELLQ